MKKHAILIGAVVALSALGAAIAAAQEYKANSIEVDQPWSTATPRGASVAAGYMTIKNIGTETDRQGKPFKATLTFAKAGPVDVNFAVTPIGTPAAPAHDAHNH
jgi:copper(I)-binding protein